ncbi:MAG: Z1 domain-containing protein [Galactobacter sp.]
MSDVNNAVEQAVLDALKLIPADRPMPLMRTVTRQLEDDGLDPLDESTLVDLLTRGDGNDRLHREFEIRLSQWNGTETLDTRVPGEGTDAYTPDRHEQVYATLELTPDSVQRMRETFRLKVDGPTLIARKPKWDPWYDPKTMQRHYWPRYRDLLKRKNFPSQAINDLDTATTQVVERLADPRDPQTWQTKGLVVGHVQSGKTANFTGVLAKAIDAGYKLIIVLTGTFDNLRSQTQKRLDKELVGRENILVGNFQDYLKAERDLADPDATEANRADAQARLEASAGKTDYASPVGGEDSDWKAGKFLETRQPLDEIDVPWITRLTNSKDYKSLMAGLDGLDFQNTLPNPRKPLYDPENINRVPVRLAVMKKNSTVLKKLAADLNRVRTKLEDLPTLIIDDEADQASVNTKRDKRLAKSKEAKERTAINQRIAEMLESLPRAQYVAYTATPFANVFVDMEDEHDIFPKDFILSLDPSPDYMGAQALHDIEAPVEDTPEYSNKAAYHRPVPMDDPAGERAVLAEALDAFVLTGAVKLLRQDLGFGSFQHHTMLVHETQLTEGHAALQANLENLWRQNAYALPAAKARLRELWDRDFKPVSAARAEEGAPIPSFDELWPRVAKAVIKIEEGVSPVVPVNGTKDSDYVKEDIAFERRSVWKILVGGAKLSRGFTIEGLTVSVYTRVTTAADTLMQMGRWFGYRTGYRDLVRIYLGTQIERRGVTGGVDLYETFTSIARDEENFRAELRQYAGFDEDGEPNVLPIDIPPLVTQRLPWLKPTSANKMYNSRITSKGVGGRLQDFALQAERGDGSGNRRAVLSALDILGSLTDFTDSTGAATFESDLGTSYPAYYGAVPAESVLRLFNEMPWINRGTTYEPEIKFIEQLIANGKLEDFVVVVPKLPSGTKIRSGFVDGHPDLELGLITRTRRGEHDNRAGFSGSNKRQRNSIERIAQYEPQVEADTGGALAAELAAEHRGAVLLNFSADFPDGKRTSDLPDGAVLAPENVAVHLSMSLPYHAAPKGVIQREVIRKDLDEAYIDKSQAGAAS